MLVAPKPLRKGRIPINGERVRALRERRFAWTRLELAMKIGKSESAIQAIETGATPSVYQRTLRSLADAFGMSFDEAKKELAPRGDWDSNVEPYSEQPLAAEIPLFDLAIAAGGWVEVAIDNEGNGHHCTSEQIRQGLFRVRVRGDSMTPRFAEGDVIEFRLLCTREGTPDFERMETGQPYYVQRNDGTATFKELAELQEEQLVLRATNKKYKQPLTARYDEITRLARYEYKLVK